MQKIIIVIAIIGIGLALYLVYNPQSEKTVNEVKQTIDTKVTK